MTSYRKGPSYILELDGMRGLAILMVLWMHSKHVTSDWWLNAPKFFGRAGVDLFFLLSGFLICRILLSSERGWPSLLSFWKRRIARIFPVAYLGLVLIALVWPGYDVLHAGAYILNITRVVTDLEVTGPVGHYWSLCVEEQFYLVLPLCILFMTRKHSHRLMLASAVIIPVLGLGLSLYMYELGITASSIKKTINYLTIPRGWPLILGALFAYYEDYLRKSEKALPIISAICVTLALGITLQPIEVPDVLRATFISQLVCQISLTALFAIILFPPTHRIVPIFSNPMLLWIGEISYGLYVYHFPIYRLFGVLDRNANLWQLVLAIAITFLVSIASMRWMELPIRNWVRAHGSVENVRTLPYSNAEQSKTRSMSDAA